MDNSGAIQSNLTASPNSHSYIPPFFTFFFFFYKKQPFIGIRSISKTPTEARLITKKKKKTLFLLLPTQFLFLYSPHIFYHPLSPKITFPIEIQSISKKTNLSAKIAKKTLLILLSNFHRTINHLSQPKNDTPHIRIHQLCIPQSNLTVTF